MVPVSLAFIENPKCNLLRQQFEQAAVSGKIISAVSYYGEHQFLFTVTSLVMADLSIGMKAAVSGTTLLDGLFKVMACDYTANTVLLYIPGVTPETINLMSISSGTLTPSGTTPIGNMVNGIRLENNDGELLGFSYSGTGPFVFFWDKSVDLISLQVIVENTSSSQSVDFTIKHSLYPITSLFTDFSTPLTFTAATNELITIKDEGRGKWIEVDVTAVNNSAIYVVAVA